MKKEIFVAAAEQLPPDPYEKAVDVLTNWVGAAVRDKTENLSGEEVRNYFRGVFRERGLIFGVQPDLLDFSDQDIRSYWLEQLDKAASLPVQDWVKSEIQWPKDKAVVYATMAICMQKYSKFKIIPDSFKKTSQYEANKRINFAVEYYADVSSTEYLSYIESDLKAKGLLPLKSDDETKDKIPKT